MRDNGLHKCPLCRTPFAPSFKPRTSRIAVPRFVALACALLFAIAGVYMRGKVAGIRRALPPPDATVQFPASWFKHDQDNEHIQKRRNFKVHGLYVTDAEYERALVDAWKSTYDNYLSDLWAFERARRRHIDAKASAK